MNVSELLKKYAKKGEVFYTTIGGNVPLIGIGRNGSIQISEDGWCDLDEEGRLMHDGEMVIFPSKDQRDWSVWAEEKEANRGQLQKGDYVTFEGGWGRIAEIEDECNVLVNSYAVQGLLTSSWRAIGTLTKLEHFDANLLKSFDKVLVKEDCDSSWCCAHFSHLCADEERPYALTTLQTVAECIPYNNETEFLKGTGSRAPEFYNQTSINIK